MKLLRKIYAGLRALLITGIAGSTALSQEGGYVDQEEADWDTVRRAMQREGGGAAFQRYLELHPAGRHAPQALRGILGEPAPEPGAGPEDSDLY